MLEVSRPALLDGSFHHHLLRDSTRLRAFREAILRQVRPGDVVADIGSGSGILAYFAIQAGARKVHAVESNTYSFRQLTRLVRENGLEGVVVPTLADGTRWTPPERIDVVACELMETGLLHESIPAVVRNVHAWTDGPRAFVPARVQLLASGVEIPGDVMGYRVRLPGFRAEGEEETPLTARAVYADYDFRAGAPSERLDTRFELVASKRGVVSGLELRTRTMLCEGLEVGASSAYCTPIVLPIEAPIEVEPGDRLRGRIEYEFEYTAQPLRFDLSQA